MHRVELKVELVEQTELAKIRFLMHRVELKGILQNPLGKK